MPRRWVSLSLGLVVWVCAAAARGGLVYFQVSQIPSAAEHHDSFVLPLSDPADIAPARDLISQVSQNDPLSIDQQLRDGHAARFNGSADVEIEIPGGSPGLVHSDVPDWIRNTQARNGFCNYTVTAELSEPSPAPQPIPLESMLPAGAALLATTVFISHRSKRSAPATTA